MLSLNKYQDGALTTAVYPKQFSILYPALGLNGEAGEVADKVKKIVRDTQIQKNEDGAIKLSDEQRKDIALECGDVLWYVATMAHDLGYTLDEIGQMNLDKLKSRMERGKISGSGDNR